MISSLLRSVASVFLFTATAAQADDGFFPSAITLDATNTVTERGFVGYANFDDYLASSNPSSPTVTMVAGASIGTDMQLFNASVLNMTGGTIGMNFGSLLAYDDSTAVMSGGLVGQHVTLQAASRFFLSGGTVFDDVTSTDDGFLQISGGSIGHSLLLNSFSHAQMSGGSVAADIFVQESSMLTMYGPDLTSVLTDPNFSGFYSQYTLDGHLFDGTDLSGRTVLVQNGSGAGFFLSSSPVPEPATWSLLIVGFGFVGIALRRRTARSVYAAS